MALKVELVPDRDRGPGYALLKVSGFPSGPGRLQILRNQGQDFLASDGSWRSEQSWHDLVFGDDGSVSLGPVLTDPLAILPPNARIQITVEAAGLTARGVQGVTGLYPSLAALPIYSPSAMPEIDLAPVVMISDPVDSSVSVSRGMPSSVSRRSLAILLAFSAFFLLCGTIGYLFYESDYKALSGSEPLKPDALGGVSISDVHTREDLAAFIATSPSGDEAASLADILMNRQKSDLAMLAYRYAARAGSPSASLALGRFYDPEARGAETGPIETPDIETAAYWYEPAALSGNTEAQRRLGKILVTLDPDGYGRSKGLEWLRKAADAGDREAAVTLRELEK